MRALALVALAALTAHAEPGFFRDRGDRTMQRNVMKTDYQCTARVAYNTQGPAGGEVSGVSLTCTSTIGQALAAAAALSKVFVLGEPAKDPNYECVVQVFWNDPSAPTTTLSGDTSCPAFESAALTAAAQLWLR